MFHKFLHPSPLGLDISDNAITLAKGKNIRVKVKTGDNPSQDLQMALKQADLKSGYVALSLPERHSFMKLVRTKGNPKKIIRENIPLPLDNIYYDTKPTKEGVFVSAGIKKAVKELLKLVKQANLLPISVEPGSLAIARVLAPRSGVVIILDQDQSGTNFIITSGKLVYFTTFRPVEDFSTLEQLARQTADYLNFFEEKHRQDITKVILSGEAKKSDELINILAEKSGHPVEIAPEPDFVKAIGLSSYNPQT